MFALLPAMLTPNARANVALRDAPTLQPTPKANRRVCDEPVERPIDPRFGRA
jgi:hypothetical protein